MTHDQGERWDNRRSRPGYIGGNGPDPDEPWNRFFWRGPTNPAEAAACDRIMVALGTLPARRQFSNHYDTDAIYRAMRNVRKASE